MRKIALSLSFLLSAVAERDVPRSGLFELSRGGRTEARSRGGRSIGTSDDDARFLVMQAKFGTPAVDGARHRVALVDTACDLSTKYESLAGAYVVARRGECPYGQKALFVARNRASGLVVIDTLSESKLLQMEAEDKDILIEVAGIVAVFVNRTSGDAIAKAASEAAQLGVSLQGRLLFEQPDCAPQPPHRKVQEQSVQQLVRQAFKPSFANSETLSPVPITAAAVRFSNGLTVNIIALPGHSIPIHAFSTSLVSSINATYEDDDGDDIDSPVIIAVDSSDPGARLLSREKSRFKYLLLGNGDDSPLPEHQDVSGSFAYYAAPRAAVKLSSALETERFRLEIRSVDPRPRLIRTWRELSRLNFSSYSSSHGQQSRIYGALKRLVHPTEGDEPDEDQWDFLQSIWANHTTNSS